MLGAATFLIAASVAHADVRVEGTPDAVRIEAGAAALPEVLSALGALHVRYRTATPLDGTINGQYRGSLRQVLADVLNGYNYVIRSDGDTTEVVIVGRTGDRPVVSTRVPETPVVTKLPGTGVNSKIPDTGIDDILTQQWREKNAKTAPAQKTPPGPQPPL